MNPHLFAEKHLGEYKTKNNEIVTKYCPFCEGGQNHDKYTFAMTLRDGAYNCKRGTCDAKGSFTDLLRHYGEPVGTNLERTKKPVEYTPPQTTIDPAKKKVEDYLRKRRFTKETWEARGVGEVNGNIAFPYFENGELVMVKYRKPEKYTGKGQKAWRDPGGKPVFWGMDNCNPQYPLIIVEGEMDALALDECGIDNVVSVPSGNKDLTCVEICWDWLEQFDQVVIWPDNDDPGKEMLNNLIKRLGAWRCWVVEADAKDANEALYLYGKDEVIRILHTAKEVPVSGLVRLAEVGDFDPLQSERIKSSVQAVNNIIGGYMLGLLSVWTGINGSGKSTFLGQEMLSAIDQGYKVCVYSGELPAPMFRYWVDLQAAGPSNLNARFDQIKETDVYSPKKEVVEYIRRWYYDDFFLYDSFGGAGEDSIWEIFEYAYRRYGCKVFLIDNLMTVVLGGNEKDFYRRQSDFVGKAKSFAHHWGVHVHLVAHPRKSEGRLGKMDVMGSGDITNRADNVLSTHRCDEEERAEYQSDGILDLFKDRLNGVQDTAVTLQFDRKSKRFYRDVTEKMRKFGWEV